MRLSLKEGEIILKYSVFTNYQGQINQVTFAKLGLDQRSTVPEKNDQTI